jgi:N-acetylneuraminic acid mutarotase
MISPLSDPSPRAGHSLTLNPETNEIFLFGGANHEEGFLDSLFIQKDGVWKNQKIFTSVQGPSARYEHTALSITRKDAKGLLVMFGAGVEGPLNDFWFYEFTQQSWVRLETRGVVPCPRVLRSVGFVESKNRVYVFGGGHVNNQPVCDQNMYCFDIQSLFWAVVQSQGPSKRLGHSFVTIRDKIYMFGGIDGDVVYNDFWEFDTSKNQWTEIETENRPSPRCAHSMVLLGDKIAVIGGMIANPPTVFDSMHLLDLEKRVWETIHNTDFKKLDMGLCSTKGGVYVYGGMDLEHVFCNSFNLLSDGTVQYE